jgi:hypothetical protein
MVSCVNVDDYVKQLSFNCLHVNFVRIVLNSVVMWTDIGMPDV